MVGRIVVLSIALTGCDLFFPLDARPVIDAPPGSDPDSPMQIDAPACSGLATCTHSKGDTSVGCMSGPVTLCEPRAFQFCDCMSADSNGGLFIFPNETFPATRSDVVYINPRAITVSLRIGGLCPGQAHMTCELPCGSMPGALLSRWDNLEQGPGQVSAQVFQELGGGPCNDADMVLDVNIERD